MSMNTHGTCGNCGGPVQSPMHWGGYEPPPKMCSRCGAIPEGEYGPVMPMVPNKNTRRYFTPGSAYDLNEVAKIRKHNR